MEVLCGQSGYEGQDWVRATTAQRAFDPRRVGLKVRAGVHTCPGARDRDWAGDRTGNQWVPAAEPGDLLGFGAGWIEALDAASVPWGIGWSGVPVAYTGAIEPGGGGGG